MILKKGELIKLLIDGVIGEYLVVGIYGGLIREFISVKNMANQSLLGFTSAQLKSFLVLNEIEELSL